jgi:hypothetical protein
MNGRKHMHLSGMLRSFLTFVVEAFFARSF